MPFDSANNYSKGKTCADCDKPVVNWATWCKKCSAIHRERKLRPPTYKDCKNCGRPFRLKPSQIDELVFCSLECKKSHGLIPCPICGKMFRVNPSNRTEKSTCSRKCRGMMKRNRIQVTCHQCGKVFARCPSQVTKEKSFCCMKCKQDFWRGSNHSSYNSIECTCQTCNKTFIRTKYKVDKFGGKYCSQHCSSLAQVIPGTSEYRGPNWDEQRRKARKRDNYTCQGCGIDQHYYGKCLDVHHIIPFRNFGVEKYLEANRLENLVSLCKTCHMRIEKGGASLDELKKTQPQHLVEG